MTVLAFRSRGRRRTGVPVRELISRATMYDTVKAPVCGTCGSVNLNPRVDSSFGPFFICEDCMTQLDTDGSRI